MEGHFLVELDALIGELKARVFEGVEGKSLAVLDLFLGELKARVFEGVEVLARLHLLEGEREAKLPKALVANPL